MLAETVRTGKVQSHPERRDRATDHALPLVDV